MCIVYINIVIITIWYLVTANRRELGEQRRGTSEVLGGSEAVTAGRGGEGCRHQCPLSSTSRHAGCRQVEGIVPATSLQQHQRRGTNCAAPAPLCREREVNSLALFQHIGTLLHLYIPKLSNQSATQHTSTAVYGACCCSYEKYLLLLRCRCIFFLRPPQSHPRSTPRRVLEFVFGLSSSRPAA